MNTDVYIVLYTKDGKSYAFSSADSFVFRKDKYTPYTELSVSFTDNGNTIPEDSVINRIRFDAGGNSLHHGLIDNAEVRRENGVVKVNVRSRGFTSLLMSNQMEPGLYSRISLDMLMENYYTFPYVQWEKDSSVCNYIYIKPNRSVWDSVVNMAYKLYGTHPYIRKSNEVTLKPRAEYRTAEFGAGDYTASGWCVNTRGLMSHLHMQDLEGNYGVYSHSYPSAEDMLIVRHKQVPFDRQYLNDPEMSMELTFALAAKGWKSKYIEIPGCAKVDVFDHIFTPDMPNGKPVAAVMVKGDSRGVKSRFYIYDDPFSAD